MSNNKPFHRNYRPVKGSPNAGYSSWAYIVDRDYAEHPEHYIRAFSMIQSDLIKLFECIEPSDINNWCFSFRIHELLMRICIEVEANFKAILRANIFNPVFTSGPRQGQLKTERDWNINDFKIVNKTHHLDDYSIELPFWRGSSNIRKPFSSWKTNGGLTWYQAYNQTKHDRLNNFELANFSNLIDAFGGLCVLLSSQFGTVDFSPGEAVLGINSDSYFSGEFGIGGFLMVKFPNNWNDSELYDFNWAVLKNEQNRFNKIDYDNI